MPSENLKFVCNINDTHLMLRVFYSIFSLACFLLFTSFSSVAIEDERHHIDSILRNLSQVQDADARVNAFNRLAYLYGSFDIDSSSFYLSQAYDLAQANNYIAGLATTHEYMARVEMEKIHLNKAILHFDTAIVLFKQLEDHKSTLNCYMAQSYLYSYKKSMLNTLECNQKALPLADMLGDSVRISLIYNNIGSFYYQLNDFDNAYRYFEKSLAVNAAIGNVRKDVALTYSNLGLLLVRHKKLEEAAELFETIEGLILIQKNKYYKATLLLSAASFYNVVGEFESAKSTLNKAEVLLNKIPQKQLNVRFLRTYADWYFFQGDFAAAIDSYNDCLILQSELGVEETLPDIYTKLSQAYYALKDYKTAYAAMEQAKKIGESSDSKRVTYILSEFEEQKFRLEQEHEHLHQVLAYQQSKHLAQKMRSRYFVALLFIFFLVSGLLIIITNMRKLRTRGVMLEEKNQLISQQKSLLETNVKKLNDNEVKLKQYNATKDKFFSIIAHDLRSPLGSLVNFSDLLVARIKAEKTDKVLGYAETISDVSHRSLALLNNLLEWSMQQTGKMQYQPENVLVNDFLQGVLQHFNQLMPERNLSLETELLDDFQLSIDRKMMDSVFRNLISNAFKYTPDDGKVTVLAKMKKDKILFCVKDTGVGMNKEQIDKLFKIENAESTRGLRNEKGTGLGLLLCRDFVKKHKGRISVKSELGKGSTFCFKIPI